MTTHSPATDPARQGTETTESGDDESRSPIGRWERLGSAVIGGALVARGLRRRSLRGVATSIVGGTLIYRGLTGRSRLYRALETSTDTDSSTGTAQNGAESRATQPPTVERTITVGRSADELTDMWRDPSQLTRIVGGFADVSEVAGTDDRHHWRVQMPLGRPLEWDAKIVADEPGERLRWESIEEAPVDYDWTVSFQPASGDRGTEVTLEISYDPPGGSLGNRVMSRLGVGPSVLAGRTLQRFKSLAETGEIPSLEANPSARGKGDVL